MIGCDGQREEEETPVPECVRNRIVELPGQDIVISVACEILVPCSSVPVLNSLSGRGRVARVSKLGIGRGV